MSNVHTLATAPQAAKTRQLWTEARTGRQSQHGLVSPQGSVVISLGSDPNLQTPHPAPCASKCRGVSILRGTEVAAVCLLPDRAGRIGGMSVSTGNPAGGSRPRLALEHDMVSFQPIAQIPSLPIRRHTAQHAMSLRP